MLLTILYIYCLITYIISVSIVVYGIIKKQLLTTNDQQATLLEVKSILLGLILLSPIIVPVIFSIRKQL